MTRSTRLPTPSRLVLAAVSACLAIALPLAAAAPAQDRPHDAVPVPVGTVQIQTLTDEVRDPTGIEVADDGRVVIIERTGRVKVWHQDGTLNEAGQVPVGANACFDCPDDLPEEGGLHGLLLAPDHLDTGEIYLYRSIPHSMDNETHKGIFTLSRFVLDPETDELDLDSEEPLLDVEHYFPQCCHYAGDLEWMADGTILLATGDDTNPFQSSGFSPHDNREGNEWNDARRTAGNPADRRGKVLRLNPDGTVPADNPHVDDPAYDPYVYAMGFRNPYRIAVHEASQAVLVGNVGPDAYFADSNRGPEGMDELEVVPAGGGTNHGWPYCIGDNEPYVEYDFASSQSGEPFDCSEMTPAEIFYPYGPSTDFPTLTAGLRATMSGPVYDYDGDGALRLPAAFQGRVLVSDWARELIFTVPMDEGGNIDGVEVIPFDVTVNRAIDLELGPDGAVYVAAYGGPGFWNNSNSEISRITCLGCSPDPGDYAGAPAVSTLTDLDTTLQTPARSGLDPRAVALVVALALGLGVPLRRRLA